jgi:predicted transcriptional regulator
VNTGIYSPSFIEMILMMKNRTEAEILVEILRSAFEASTATTMINKCSITYSQLQQYLPHLIESGLLDYTRETESYRTMPRGVHVVSVYEQLEAESRHASVAT